MNKETDMSLSVTKKKYLCKLTEIFSSARYPVFTAYTAMDFYFEINGSKRPTRFEC